MPRSDTDFDLLISGGTVVTEKKSSVADIGIRDGRVAAVGNLQNCVPRNHIKAEGLVVMPGGIDVHVHMSLPFGGTVSSDDFRSGSRAAALGGTTTMIDFASQIPKTSLCDAIHARKREADQQTYIDYALHLIINDAADRWLREIPEVLALGVPTFKAFTAYPNEGLMLSRVELRALMKHAARYGAQVDVHAEDGLAIEANRRRFIELGQTAMVFHPRSRPATTESEAIIDVLSMAHQTGCKVHIHHLSTADGLRHIEAATDAVSAETCPQYLLLDASLYGTPEAALYAVSPPLREPRDSEALWIGLRSGSISMVATDHCPFTYAQKTAVDRAFTEIPNGIPGIETRIPLMFSEAVVKRGFSLPLFTQIVSTNPARRFGMYPQKGTIRPGSDADLVLLDPKAHKRIKHAKLHMNCDWSPYEGMEVTGWPVTTLLRGEILCQDEEWIPAKPKGRFIPRKVN
ncbi:dihydropyrimidinase [Candidatus Bipolaricaulota bacterium]|nr:dihydropyrimidinase [Candidatus Bipolaricaulota bacterium]